MANIQRKRVLLIEPNYANKFPPVGLMKIATYHKRLGFEVVFFKGDLKQFIIERIADKCIKAFTEIDDSIDWRLRKDLIIEYIHFRKKYILEQLELRDSKMEFLLYSKLSEYKDYYQQKTWEKQPEWDRVFVTTLFTFYWKITVDTILLAKKLVKPDGILQVGGVLATIQANEIEHATGIKPHKGILRQGDIDIDNDIDIDSLPLDYSILDEIDYKYSMSNAFYGYTTRGCIRSCPFCAVPLLEPKYEDYIPLRKRIEQVRKLYGDQKDLLLMDNNVLASKMFPEIIEDIVDSGFGRDSKFTQPDLLAIAIKNLQNGINDRAYIRKSQSLMMDFYNKLKGEESYTVYKVLKQYSITKYYTSTKENLIAAYSEIKDIYAKHFHPTSRSRFVDFNQGVDARLFTEENVALLSKINIRPLRIAFDSIKVQPIYEKAIRMSKNVGIKDFSNYLLYNYTDKPIELYRRLKINIDLCEELSISIYSFPMKYHPITGKYSHNRDFIGRYWNRKHIRAIQAILNSTKGKIGRGHDFFYEAFGHTEEEFYEILDMPETFILYRFFFKWLNGKYPASTDNWRKCWYDCMESLDEYTKNRVLEIIHTNTFNEEIQHQFDNPKITKLLGFYTNYRKDIITPYTDLYKLKREYDANPTRILKRKKGK
jgi:hypothetical protein